MELWLGLSLGFYVVAMVVLGLFASRRIEADEDYLVAGRRLPLWLAWGTLLATWFGAATVLGASEAAREQGVRGTILDPFASGIALIVAGLFFARPVWEMKLLTVGDLFARKFGRRTELVSSIVQAIGYLPWIAAQYLALATVLTHFFGLDVRVAIVGVALFVMFLTMSGGMWSVTLTDTAQILLVLVSLVVLGMSFFAAIGGGSITAGITTTWQQTPPDLRTLLPQAGTVALLVWSATWLNGIFGNIPGQDLMQRLFSAKSSRVAQQACLLAGIVYILFGMLPVGLGLASRLLWPGALPQGSGGHVLLALAEQFLTPPMICLFAVAVVAIVVSTCTSALLSPSALLAHNLLGRMGWFADRKLLTNRLSVVLITAASLPIAFSTDRILLLLEEAVAVGLVALIVPFFAGVYGSPKGDRSGLLSILCGGGVWIIHKLAAWALADPNAPAAGLTLLIETIPPEFTGITASLLGYFVGQQFSNDDGWLGSTNGSPQHGWAIDSGLSATDHSHPPVEVPVTPLPQLCAATVMNPVRVRGLVEYPRLPSCSTCLMLQSRRFVSLCLRGHHKDTERRNFVPFVFSCPQTLRPGRAVSSALFAVHPHWSSGRAGRRSRRQSRNSCSGAAWHWLSFGRARPILRR